MIAASLLLTTSPATISLPAMWLSVSTQALGWTLVHFVWQGAAVAGFLIVFLRIARNRTPQIRYLAGCAALALMCGGAVATLIVESQAVTRRLSESSQPNAPTLIPLRPSILAEASASERDAASSSARKSPIVLTTTSAAPTDTRAKASPSPLMGFAWLNSLPRQTSRVAERLEPYLPWIVCAWAVGVVLLSLRLLAGWIAVRELRVAADATDRAWLERFHRLKTRLGVSYPVRLVFSTSAKVPMVIGWLKPVVLVPAGLITGLNAEQLEAILAHELVHIRRHDYLVNLVQNVLETLFFYHPAVAWVSNRIRIEREHCCDDGASLACGGTLQYARALAALAESRRAPILSVAATGGSLVERIRRLANRTEHDSRRGLSPGAVTLLPLAVAVISLMALGVAVAQQGASRERAAEPGRAVTSAAKPTKETSSSTPGTTPNEMIAIRGTVLLPDGRPAAGAKIFALRSFETLRENWVPLATTATDSKGEFSLRLPALKDLDGRSTPVWITARAPGFGLQWTTAGSVIAESGGVAVLKLAPEVPVHGRIVDLEGRPVRDVRVKVLQQRPPEMRRFPDERSRREMVSPVRTFDDESQPPVQTDADGRFVLGGIGADRIATVEIRGETIAYAQLNIDTRKDRTTPQRRPRFERRQVFGPDFSYQAAPTKPILGTVRDAATGKPLAGVTIAGGRIAGSLGPNRQDDIVHTTSDAEGRYRLVGLPKPSGSGRASRNEIDVVPNAEQPYFFNRIDVPDTPGLAPVTLDINLTRGVWITGRVTDKVTGKPVPSSLQYFPFLTNPFAKDRPEFRRRGGRVGDNRRNVTRPDGSFRLVGLPGRGIVAADASPWAARSSPRAFSGSYRKGVGASEIAGMAKNGEFPTFGPIFRASARENDALREINPAEGAESVVCNLVLDPGGTLQIHLVDREGKPVEKCRVTEHKWAVTTQGGARESTFDLTGLSPNESRGLLILKPERNIGKVLMVRYDEKGPREITVKLEPCATIKGRLLDEDGEPERDLNISAEAQLGAGLHSIPATQFPCDSEGRFVNSHLAPGGEFYRLEGIGLRLSPMGRPVIADKVVVAPGQTIDLGDIKLKRQ